MRSHSHIHSLVAIAAGEIIIVFILDGLVVVAVAVVVVEEEVPGSSLIRVHFFNQELSSISNNQSLEVLDVLYQNLTNWFILFYAFIGNFDF